MYFVTNENNHSELFLKYLAPALSADEIDINPARVLFDFAKAEGIDKPGDYSESIFELPPWDFSEKVRDYTLNAYPRGLFDKKQLLENINFDSIIEILRKVEGSDESEKVHPREWLKNTIKERRETGGGDPLRLNILVIGGGHGQEAFSLAMKARLALPAPVDIRVVVLESSEKNIEKASMGEYRRDQGREMGDNFRSIYTESLPGSSFMVTEEIKNFIQFKVFNPGNSEHWKNLNDKYHIIDASVINREYTGHQARFIIGRALVRLHDGGILLSQVSPGGESKNPGVFIKNGDIRDEISEYNALEDEEYQLVAIKSMILKKKTDEALNKLRELPEHILNKPLFRQLNIEIIARLGEFEEAIETAEEVINKHPGFLPAVFALAVLNQNTRRTEKARETVSLAIELISHNMQSVYSLPGYKNTDYLSLFDFLNSSITEGDKVEIDRISEKIAGIDSYLFPVMAVSTDEYFKAKNQEEEQRIRREAEEEAKQVEERQQDDNTVAESPGNAVESGHEPCDVIESIVMPENGAVKVQALSDEKPVATEELKELHHEPMAEIKSEPNHIEPNKEVEEKTEFCRIDSSSAKENISGISFHSPAKPAVRSDSGYAPGHSSIIAEAQKKRKEKSDVSKPKEKSKPQISRIHFLIILAAGLAGLILGWIDNIGETAAFQGNIHRTGALVTDSKLEMKLFGLGTAEKIYSVSYRIISDDGEEYEGKSYYSNYGPMDSVSIKFKTGQSTKAEYVKDNPAVNRLPGMRISKQRWLSSWALFCMLLILIGGSGFLRKLIVPGE